MKQVLCSEVSVFTAPAVHIVLVIVLVENFCLSCSYISSLERLCIYTFKGIKNLVAEVRISSNSINNLLT